MEMILHFIDFRGGLNELRYDRAFYELKSVQKILAKYEDILYTTYSYTIDGNTIFSYNKPSENGNLYKGQ